MKECENMNKRVLLLCLCFTFVFSIFVNVYAEDMISYSYSDAVASLERFDVIDKDVDINSKLTFGDFLGMAMKLTGMGEMSVDTSKSIYVIYSEK